VAAMASGAAAPAHVVSPAQMQAMLDDATRHVVVLDSSWHMPTSGRSGRADFVAGRVLGALFFDLDGVKDAHSPLPHMLPPPHAFAAACDALGIREETHVVVYDTLGVFSSPRAWFTFRALGHTRVSVLNGGLLLWRAEGRPVEEGDCSTPVDAASLAATAAQAAPARPCSTHALNTALVKSMADVRTHVVETPAVVLVDARPAGRFEGTVPEPRPGLRGGHIPGSRSIPFAQVLTPQGVFKSPEELRAIFASADASLDAKSPLWASCGTGVTACILALAAATAGREDVAVYDGSWTEWGAPDLLDTPVAMGAQ
jgi:thiosulfate/3-mercaptopyruvate sulfurtransferase